MDPDYISAFDALHTNHFIQKLKIIHAFSEPEIQHFMAVYIKFLELQYTLENAFHYHALHGSADTVMEALCPFCTPAQQKQLKQLKELLDFVQTAKTVSETMELMKDIFPAEDSEGAGEHKDASAFSFADGPAMEQLLLSMLPEEQRSLFESLINSDE